MRIESGHPATADVKVVNGDQVRFVTEDGRTMFDVAICKDGRSIEIRGVEATKHDGQIYGTHLLVQPQYANSVIVQTKKYEGS